MTRTVLVTGAGRGIGLAITERLAAAGWTVYAGARSESQRAELGTRSGVVPVRLDITDADDLVGLDDALPDRLDAVVNNAGMLSYGPVEALSPEHIRQVLDLNVTAQAAVTQAVLPRLRASRGRAVFISSTSGLIATPWSGAYNASKFALEGLVDALRIELRPWDVRVSLVEPGTTDTAMWQDSLATFDAVVEQLSDEHRALYARQVKGMRRALGIIRRTAVPPDRVARAVEKALTAQRPRARYRCDLPSRVQVAVTRSSPTRAVDAVLATAIGARKP